MNRSTSKMLGPLLTAIAVQMMLFVCASTLARALVPVSLQLGWWAFPAMTAAILAPFIAAIYWCAARIVRVVAGEDILVLLSPFGVLQGVGAAHEASAFGLFYAFVYLSAAALGASWSYKRECSSRAEAAQAAVPS